MVMYMADVHRIFLGRSIELDSQNTSGAFGNNVTHLPPPVAGRFQIRRVRDCAASAKNRLYRQWVKPSSLSAPRRYARRFQARAWRAL